MLTQFYILLVKIKNHSITLILQADAFREQWPRAATI